MIPQISAIHFLLTFFSIEVYYFPPNEEDNNALRHISSPLGKLLRGSIGEHCHFGQTATDTPSRQ